MTCSLAALLFVTITSYSPTVAQTDSTPWVTACGTRPEIGTVAISQDLFRTPGFHCGEVVLVNGQPFIVNDTMHYRLRLTVDILRLSVREALAIGRRPGTLCALGVRGREQSRLRLPPPYQPR